MVNDNMVSYMPTRVLLGSLGVGYVLGMLPQVLFSAKLQHVLDFPSFVIVFLFGIVLGVLGTVIGIIVMFFILTQPTPLPTVDFVAEESAKVDSQVAVTLGGRERDVTRQGPTMPHSITYDGKYQGIVFTVPMSKWKRKECVMDWPPLYEPLTPWFAEIDQGTLVLHPITFHKENKRKHQKKGSVGSKPIDTLHERLVHSNNAQKLGIPLEGCVVEVVRDGLQGRSDMIRRAPLFVCHQEWLLMDGEHGFYMFADTPASKMQWVAALRYWSSCSDDVPRAIPDLYEEYCKTMKERNPLTPYLSEENVDLVLDPRPSEPLHAQRQQWRPWKRLPRNNRGTQAPSNGVTKATNIDVLLDNGWMHGGVLSMGAKSKHRMKASDAEDASLSGKTAGNNSSSSIATEMEHSPRDNTIYQTPFASPAKTMPELEADPGGSPQRGISRTVSKVAIEHWPEKLPSLLSADHFVNDLLARGCFDIVRNPAFSNFIKVRVQAQLSRMHSPDYVQSLEVLEVHSGYTAPTVANFSALPSPSGSSIMPQLIFDMKYEGEFSITIGCKVDIRDSPGWEALDKALDVIEGKNRFVHNNEMEVQFLEDMENLDGELFWENDQEELELLRRASGITAEDEKELCEHKNRKHMSRMSSFEAFRYNAAQRLRKFADSTAAHISRIPLQVKLTFSVIEGQMCLWVPPPPGNRLFWSFLSPPKLKIRATPNVGGRFIKYAYHASRASAWIEARMKLAFTKNLVFPSGGDFPIPGMLSVDAWTQEKAWKNEYATEEHEQDDGINPDADSSVPPRIDDTPACASSTPAGPSSSSRYAPQHDKGGSQKEKESVREKTTERNSGHHTSPFFEIRLRGKTNATTH